MRPTILICLASLTYGCSGEDLPALPDASIEVIQGAEARGELVINEVAPRPSEGVDWIELLNRSAEALDLCEFFISDSLDRLDHYYHLAGAPPPNTCSPTMLAPGEFLVVYADDDQGAPFRLGDADEVHVISREGEALDSILYFHDRERGTSLARLPSGEGAFYYAPATPNAHNSEAP